MVRLRRVLPRNSRNTQKLLAEKSLPRMRTDAHRWFGCVGFSHGIHEIHRSFWRRRASHRCHRCPQIVRLRMVLWKDSLVGCVGMAGMPYPPNLCISAICGRIPCASRFCVFCVFCGRISCVRSFCGFCGFCGKIVRWLRGYGRMPYPPNLCTSVQSVGEYLASVVSVCSVGSVGEYLASEASVDSVGSVGRYFGGCVGMAGCHTLL